MACAGNSGDATGDAIDITVGDTDLHVWEADTSSERNRGLMDLASLPDGIDGMLFTYQAPSSATFTMKNTLMPLDLWWFNSSGVLIGRTEMEPCTEDECTDYRSPGLIMWTIETPAGLYDFDVGDVLSTGENS